MRHDAEQQMGPRVRFSVPRGGGRLLSKETFTRVMLDLLRQLNVRVSVDGAQLSESGSSGASVSITPGSGASELPLQLRGIPSAVRVLPGLIGDITPTIGGTAITVTPAPTLNAGTSSVVYAIVTTTLNLINDWVESAEVTSVVIAAASSLPSDTNNVFHIRLGFVTSDGRVYSERGGSLGVYVRDNGLGQGAGRCFFWNV